MYTLTLLAIYNSIRSSKTSYPCGVPLQGSNTAEHAWTANLSGISDYRSLKGGNFCASTVPMIRYPLTVFVA